MTNYVCPRCGQVLGSVKPALCTYCRQPLENVTSRHPPQHSSHEDTLDDSYREPELARASHARHLNEELQAFNERLQRLTPRARLTRILVAINVGVFLVMVISGVGFADPDAESLFNWGANLGLETTRGQWWRLLTCTFIHVGFIHLVFNMWCLNDVGPLVERLVGSAGFLILYLFSGLVGSLASTVWSPSIVSAGASGSIFGVFGALLGIYRRAGNSIPSVVLQQHRSSIGVFLIVNLVIGLSMPRIDMAGHVGGLIAGFLCGMMLGHPINENKAADRSRRNAIAIIAATVVVVLGALVARERLAPIHSAFDELVKIERIDEQQIAAYNLAVDRGAKGQITDNEFLAILERDILPPWQDARWRLEQIRDLPKEYRPHWEELRRYLAAREQGIEMLVQSLRSQDQRLSRQALEKMREADQIAGRLAAGTRNRKR